MDYVPGEDLRALDSRAARRNGFLDEKMFWIGRVRLPIALDYLHNQQPPIVHRDIKPSNLKLTPPGGQTCRFRTWSNFCAGEVTITILHGRVRLSIPAGQSVATACIPTAARISTRLAVRFSPVTIKLVLNVRDRFLDRKVCLSALTDPAISPGWGSSPLGAAAPPDDRPADVRAFLKALTGKTTNHLRGSLVATAPNARNA
jgi:serine/threonine-protein kinase